MTDPTSLGIGGVHTRLIGRSSQEGLIDIPILHLSRRIPTHLGRCYLFARPDHHRHQRKLHRHPPPQHGVAQLPPAERHPLHRHVNVGGEHGEEIRREEPAGSAADPRRQEACGEEEFEETREADDGRRVWQGGRDDGGKLGRHSEVEDSGDGEECGEHPSRRGAELFGQVQPFWRMRAGSSFMTSVRSASV